MATGRVWVSAGGVATELVGVTPPSEKILEIYMQLCAYKVHIEKMSLSFRYLFAFWLQKGFCTYPPCFQCLCFVFAPHIVVFRARYKCTYLCTAHPLDSPSANDT